MAYLPTQFKSPSSGEEFFQEQVFFCKPGGLDSKEYLNLALTDPCGTKASLDIVGKDQGGRAWGLVVQIYEFSPERSDLLSGLFAQLKSPHVHRLISTLKVVRKCADIAAEELIKLVRSIIAPKEDEKIASPRGEERKIASPRAQRSVESPRPSEAKQASQAHRNKEDRKSCFNFSSTFQEGPSDPLARRRSLE